MSFRKSPVVRFWTRVVVVAVVGYVATFFATGQVGVFDSTAFLWGLGGAVFSGLAYALIGSTTPIEPFVGANKVPVEVPASQATVVRS